LSAASDLIVTNGNAPKSSADDIIIDNTFFIDDPSQIIMVFPFCLLLILLYIAEQKDKMQFRFKKMQFRPIFLRNKKMSESGELPLRTFFRVIG